MAEEHARWKQYEYAANSNLVLTADRRTREHEPSGEAESLAAVAKRKGLFRMGDRVVQSKPQALVDKKDKIDKKRRERKDKDDARKMAKVRPYMHAAAPVASRREPHAARCCLWGPRERPLPRPLAVVLVHVLLPVENSRASARYFLALTAHTAHRSCRQCAQMSPGDCANAMRVGPGGGECAGIGVGAWLIPAENGAHASSV